jgi:hypothetical protein
MNRLKQKIKAKINNGKEDKQMHVTAVTARAISVSDQDIGELFLPFKPQMAKKSIKSTMMIVDIQSLL